MIVVATDKMTAGKDALGRLAALAIISKVVGGPITAGVIAWMTMLFTGPTGLGQTLTWLGVITGVISLIGYFFAMRFAPPPAAEIALDTPTDS